MLNDTEQCLKLIPGEGKSQPASKHEVNRQQWRFLTELETAGLELKPLFKYLEEFPDETLYDLSTYLNQLLKIPGTSSRTDIENLKRTATLVSQVWDLYFTCNTHLKLSYANKAKVKKTSQLRIIEAEMLSDEKTALLDVLETHSEGIAGINPHSPEEIEGFKAELLAEELTSAAAVAAAISNAPSFPARHGLHIVA